MIKRLILLSLALPLAHIASASEWHYLTGVWTDNSLYFFDAETVSKQGNFTNIWIQSMSNRAPLRKGEIRSTTAKWHIDCGTRRIQILQSSYYDVDGDFISTNSAATIMDEPIPDTIGASVLKAVCAPHFPNSDAQKDSLVINNKTAIATDNWFEYLRQKANDEAPK